VVVVMHARSVGEKAGRRCPQKFAYMPIACPEMKKVRVAAHRSQPAALTCSRPGTCGCRVASVLEGKHATMPTTCLRCAAFPTGRLNACLPDWWRSALHARSSGVIPSGAVLWAEQISAQICPPSRMGSVSSTEFCHGCQPLLPAAVPTAPALAQSPFHGCSKPPTLPLLQPARAAALSWLSSCTGPRCPDHNHETPSPNRQSGEAAPAFQCSSLCWLVHFDLSAVFCQQPPSPPLQVPHPALQLRLRVQALNLLLRPLLCRAARGELGHLWPGC
jgi:hypothetical protein